MTKINTKFEDTIAQVSTALANNAISIVRVSGTDAFKIVSKIFSKNIENEASHTIHYGYIKDKDEVVDEVLVSIFKSPKSFTREDVVEINCHGGIFVTNKVLELLLSNGAREATPGEFTKRAFLNGRIDLTQAEAVMDTIEANTNNSLKLASLGLIGETKKLIQSFRDRVLQVMLQIEVNIDYPEYEDEVEVTNEVLYPSLKSLISEIDEVIKKSEVSQVIKNGIKTAIIGKPNVGKSSLLNALLREDKAIVTNIAGTTRDIVEGDINIGGIVLKLIDTAGVRETDDIVERIGVERSKKALQDAELVILVLDNNQDLDEVDKELLDISKDKKRIIVVNKKDLDNKIDLNSLDDYILMSSYDNSDISLLEKKIKNLCNISDLLNIDGTYIGNARQIAKLKEAKKNLEDAINSLENKMPVDIANIDINNAWINLGEIIGEVSSDDLLDELFKRFCLGK
ncbi:MAG: tRNA uridine-5-carboxymethylaminomethyl(34) synthesis GTPase MnmE [Bacilli bacterium]|nr:tRNA uridine-5-carboxymethylaminomethyl(34) synthesis GTPase MnmE [Bacilli bacterium]